MFQKESFITVADFYNSPVYRLWYKTFASFAVTLFIPIVMLGFYNGTTYKLINQRSV